MVVHEATAARQAVLRMAASHLWMRGVISASLAHAAHPPPTHLPGLPSPALTRPACRPPNGMTGPVKPEVSAPWPGSIPCASPAVPTA